MARPRGSKNKPKGDAPARSLQTIDDDAQRVLLKQHREAYERTLASKKAADANFKNACKLAKAELGKQAVAQIKLAIELSTPEGETAVRERLTAMAQVARWTGARLGTQFDMFGGGAETPTAQAHNEGKSAGINGDPAKPPYAPETEQYAAWMEGHGDGQAALLAKNIKPLDNPHSSQPAGDDAEDEGGERQGMTRAQWKAHMQHEQAEGRKLTHGIGDGTPTLETRPAH